MVTAARAQVETKRRAWEAATRAWSRDPVNDPVHTMKLGEAMMYAATDLICALEDVLADEAGR